MDNLKGRIAVISGGGKGIGKGIALALARQGVRLILGYHSSPEFAIETCEHIKTFGQAVLVRSDVGTPEGCQALVDAAIKEYGGLDILVNNAAIQTNHSMLEGQQAIIKQVMDVNLRAAFLMMQKSLPHLKKSECPRIVLISSIHGKRPTDFDVAYSMSKGGMRMLGREAAIEFGKYGITVNLIAPAGVAIEGKTGNPKGNSMRQVAHSRPVMRYPLGRRGLPKDIGDLVCFLATKESEHITGTTLRIDGGAVLL